MFKRLSLSLLFTTIFCPAHAQWTEVGTTKQLRMYIDKSTLLSESPSVRRIWTLMDYKEPLVGKYGERSVQSYTEIDCKTYSYRSLKVLMLSESMAKGIVVKLAEPKPAEANPMSAAPPSSMMDWVISQTCLL